MNGDPLDRLRRPAAPPVHATPPAGTGSGTSPVSAGTDDKPVAPEWLGPCLRLAGNAFTPSLVLRFRDGRLVALTYAYLSAVRMTPSEGIELDLVSYAVRVRGRRLKAVFEALAMHTAMELAESTTQFDEDTQHPLIESIAVVPVQER